MTQIYEVFTKLSMVNGVSPVLAVVAKEVMSLEGSITKLSGTLTTLNRTSMAVYGGLAALGGISILSGFKEVTEHAKGLTHELTQIKKLGLTDREIDIYKRAANSMPSKIAGTTTEEALKVLSTTHSMFGVDGSIKILEPLLKFEQVLGNTLGSYEKASESMKEMVRGGELIGKFVNEQTHKVDTDKLTHFLELGTKLASATHGMVNPHTWLMMAQQGGPMLSTMSDEGMLTAAMISQAMGGPRAGTALQAIGRQFLGLKMTTPTAEALASLGFFKDEPYYDKAGRLRNKYVTNKSMWSKENGPWSQEGQRFVNALQDDPLNAARILVKNLNDHGYESMKDIIPKLYQILGTDTARRLTHELVRNIPQMIDEKGRIKKGLGNDASLRVQNAEDYFQVEHNFEAAKNEMMAQIGLPMMKVLIPVMNSFSDVFKKIAIYASANPKTLEYIGRGLTVLGGALVGAGGAAILAALGPAGWIGMGLGAIGTAVALIPKDVWSGLGNGLSLIGKKADELLETLKSWGERFGGWLDGLRTKLMTALGGLWNSFTGLFSKTSYGGQGEGGGNAGGTFNGASVIRAATDPVANAASMIGAHERVNNADVQEYLRTGGVGMNPAKTAWCAAFVNASLAKAGIKGTGSAAALSFLNWGAAVNGDAHRGDIFVKNHGGGHGHVGLLTGRFQNGLAEMISGNYGNRVGRSWENLRNGFLRRAFEPPARGAGQMVQVNSAVHIEGHQIASVMTRHLAKFHEHTRQAPYFNGRGMFASNDLQHAVG